MPIIFINNIYQRQICHMLPKNIILGEKMDYVDTPQKVPTVNKGFYA
jgi:hypothetical protein